MPVNPGHKSDNVLLREILDVLKVKDSIENYIKWKDENNDIHFGMLLCVHQSMTVEIPQNKHVSESQFIVNCGKVDAAAYVRCLESEKVVCIPATWIDFNAGA